MKCASTLLSRNFALNPEIFHAEPKEVHFFDQIQAYKKGSEHYETYFATATLEQRIIGENTPEYGYFDFVPEHVLKDLGPEMRFVYNIRHPVDSLISHYWHNAKPGGFARESLGIEEALARQDKKLGKNYVFNGRFSYIPKYFYFRSIYNYVRRFGRDRLTIVDYDELRASPQTVVDRVAAFLGCRAAMPEVRGVHQTPVGENYPSKTPDAVIADLQTVFLPEIERLEALLGLDLDEWKTRYPVKSDHSGYSEYSAGNVRVAPERTNNRGWDGYDRRSFTTNDPMSW